VCQRHYWHWHVLAPGEIREQDTQHSNISCLALTLAPGLGSIEAGQAGSSNLI
jgi:hypothetical protein